MEQRYRILDYFTFLPLFPLGWNLFRWYFKWKNSTLFFLIVSPIGRLVLKEKKKKYRPAFRLFIFNLLRYFHSFLLLTRAFRHFSARFFRTFSLLEYKKRRQWKNLLISINVLVVNNASHRFISVDLEIQNFSESTIISIGEIQLIKLIKRNANTFAQRLARQRVGAREKAIKRSSESLMMRNVKIRLDVESPFSLPTSRWESFVGEIYWIFMRHPRFNAMLTTKCP